MRIVIGGGDEVALRLAEALMEAHEVVIILPEDASALVDRLDVGVVNGGITSVTVLKKSGVAKADVYIAASDQDERNLVSCVTAKRLGVGRTFCFLSRRDVLASEEDDQVVAESLGIDMVIRPAQQLAREIVRIVVVPGALDVRFFAGGRVRLLQQAVEDGAPITAGTLRAVGVPKGVVLVMGRRGQELFLPKGGTEFRAGDRITAMGSSKGLAILQRKYLIDRDHPSERRSATVVGGGSVGLAVAQGLEEAGWRVRVFETNRRRAEQIAPLVKGMVFHGDGSDLELLEQEQVAEDSVLIAVTSNDEKNLLCSLVARSLGVPRIVTRADSLSNERLFETVGIDVVRSTRGAAIESVVQTLVPEQSDLRARLEHGDAEVLEIELPAAMRPRPLSTITQPVFAIVGAIVRGGKVIIPTGATVLEGKDHLYVFCTREDEPRVRDYMLHGLMRDAEEPAA